MRGTKSILVVLVLLASGCAGAQALLASAADADATVALPPSRWDSQLPLAPPAVLPEMSPELALAVFEQRLAQQQHNQAPASYIAETTVSAELPQMHQHGEFRLRRSFTAPAESAPGRLRFTPVSFTGDGFVKTNVINRWLSSEVERAHRGPDPRSALTAANYKFRYKRSAQIDGEPAQVFQVKPRSHAAGVFKGEIYIDARSGALLRAQGRLAHSPSFFIKKIEFVTDFADFGGATMPVHIHSVADTRLIGRAIVDVDTPEYDFHPTPQLLAARWGLKTVASF